MTIALVHHQARQEQNSGYQAGLRGEPRPRPDKGRAFYNGWINGKADREEQHADATAN